LPPPNRKRSIPRDGKGNAGAEKGISMAGKKAHKPRIVEHSGTHGIPERGHGRKSAAQAPVQYGADPKGRRGQYGGAGKAPLIKK
jgi:hypothetical protein